MNFYRPRAGHTLIEILLALGLSLVILAAAYAALDQHWRYADAGQRQTERLQVTRALFERLSLDLRAVVFRVDVDARASGGIVGDHQKLSLQIDAPGSQQLARMQWIRWEMQDLELEVRDASQRGLARIAGDVAAETETASAQDVLAAEVQSIGFRYFARGSWFESWDSVDERQLPQAVEITIVYRDPAATNSSASNNSPPGEYRLVIPVPVSEARTI